MDLCRFDRGDRRMRHCSLDQQKEQVERMEKDMRQIMTVNGREITAESSISDALSAFDGAYDVAEAVSCVYSGMERTYANDDFILYTYPEGDGQEHLMEAYAAALTAEILREVPPLRARWGRAATIYVGGGTVMDNIGYIRTIDLGSWISYYGSTVTPRWGWLGGVTLG